LTGWDIFRMVTSVSIRIVNQVSWAIHVVFDEETVTCVLADDELAAVMTVWEETSRCALEWSLSCYWGKCGVWFAREPIGNPDASEMVVAHKLVLNRWTTRGE